MTINSLAGKRVLITQADAFMGPALCEVFAEHGAHVIADTTALLDSQAPARAVAAAGSVDILIVISPLKPPAPWCTMLLMASGKKFLK